MVGENQPTILYGLKGVAGLELTVKGPEQDLHSGLYGGAVRNPIMALSHILTSMKNEEEVVTIDGFYDNVDELTTDEGTLIGKVEGEEYKKRTGGSETNSDRG